MHGIDKQTENRQSTAVNKQKSNKNEQTHKISRAALRAAIQRVKKINNSRLGRDPHTPEPDEAVPDLGEVEDPDRGAQDHGRIDERPAAHHPP